MSGEDNSAVLLNGDGQVVASVRTLADGEMEILLSPKAVGSIPVAIDDNGDDAGELYAIIDALGWFFGGGE